MDGRVHPRATDGDIEGLDDSQRVEVHAYEGGGPSDGLVLNDMARDRGEDYVEDDGQPELMDQELDTLGMSIVSPEDLGDSVLDGDVDAEMNGDDDDRL